MMNKFLSTYHNLVCSIPIFVTEAANYCIVFFVTFLTSTEGFFEGRGESCNENLKVFHNVCQEAEFSNKKRA